jgi:hypothetical protein
MGISLAYDGGSAVNAIHVASRRTRPFARRCQRSLNLALINAIKTTTNLLLALLKHQQNKFERDWLALHGKVPEVSKSLYKYYWLIVNTRCFYWTHFKRAREAERKGKTLSRDDCMALCPFADYLNHADDGVSSLRSLPHNCSRV